VLVGPDAFYLLEVSTDGFFRVQKKGGGKLVPLQGGSRPTRFGAVERGTASRPAAPAGVT
jgi:hypothetical protein